MTDSKPLCPPHHWEITTVRSEGIAFYHHACLRCGAMKDVPLTSAQQPNTWRLRGSKPAAEVP